MSEELTKDLEEELDEDEEYITLSSTTEQQLTALSSEFSISKIRNTSPWHLMTEPTMYTFTDIRTITMRPLNFLILTKKSSTQQLLSLTRSWRIRNSHRLFIGRNPAIIKI